VPLQTMLGRLRPVELFGTLVPGLFLTLSIGLVRLASRAGSWANWERSIESLLAREPKWTSIALFIGASYMCGTLIRAMPSRIVDHVIGRMLRPLYSMRYFGPRLNALHRDRFPYPRMLQFVHAQLDASGYLDALSNRETLANSILRSDIDSSSFEYWKAFVAARNPGLASRQEAAESRTRFFWGMFWATFGALGVSLLGSLLAPSSLPLVWATVSACMFVLFALRYRYVTGDEVRQVYISFLTQCCVDAANETNKGQNKPSQTSQSTIMSDLSSPREISPS
jgi:hypothetical protein